MVIRDEPGFLIEERTWSPELGQNGTSLSRAAPCGHGGVFGSRHLSGSPAVVESLVSRAALGSGCLARCFVEVVADRTLEVLRVLGS